MAKYIRPDVYIYEGNSIIKYHKIYDGGGVGSGGTKIGTSSDVFFLKVNLTPNTQKWTVEDPGVTEVVEWIDSGGELPVPPGSYTIYFNDAETWEWIKPDSLPITITENTTLDISYGVPGISSDRYQDNLNTTIFIDNGLYYITGPTFSIPDNYYNDILFPLTIYINTNISEPYDIYYTTDGSTPTSSSTLYNSSIIYANPFLESDPMGTAKIIKTVLIKNGFTSVESWLYIRKNGSYKSEDREYIAESMIQQSSVIIDSGEYITTVTTTEPVSGDTLNMNEIIIDSGEYITTVTTTEPVSGDTLNMNEIIIDSGEYWESIIE